MRVWAGELAKLHASSLSRVVMAIGTRAGAHHTSISAQQPAKNDCELSAAAKLAFWLPCSSRKAKMTWWGVKSMVPSVSGSLTS